MRQTTNTELETVPTGAEKVRILLADDDPTMLEATAGLLARSGYDVITASDGEAALSTFRRFPHTIDLVISDGVMPGLGGRELLRAVSELSPSTAILLISGSPGLLLGTGWPCLAKPFRAEALATKVRTLLDARQIANDPYSPPPSGARPVVRSDP